MSADRENTLTFICIQTPNGSTPAGLGQVTLTLSVDDLIDFMWVIRILGIVLYHLEAHRQVVQRASEVGFPPGLVVGELVDFPTGYCPCLSTAQRHVYTVTARATGGK